MNSFFGSMRKSRSTLSSSCPSPCPTRFSEGSGELDIHFMRELAKEAKVRFK